jgi:hypothetical protein
MAQARAAIAPVVVAVGPGWAADCHLKRVAMTRGCACQVRRSRLSEEQCMVKTRQGYRTNRARISLALSQFTMPLLSRIYHAFDGDMVAAIVLGEIAHRNVEAWLANHENPEAALDDPARRTSLMRPCNALSIADACKLPRETVRRKVVMLVKRGYIYRSDEGFLYLTSNVGDDFVDMTADVVDHLITTARRLESLLANQPTPLPPLRLD